MSNVFGFLSRQYQIFFGAKPVLKQGDALKFGILGAANVASIAFIYPARTHPEVVIQAVAARDKTKAAAFAKKYGIPQVLDSYQALLDEPSIDCVYIPLPNGLHYEWALRALAAGKHVLLEKPSVSNAIEGESLFRHPLLLGNGEQQRQGGGPAPVLVEAFHYRFHPSWYTFLSLVDPPNVAHARATGSVPAAFIGGDDDIRWNYALAGGALMDVGTYLCSAVRLSFGGLLPEECTAADLERCAPPRDRCDHSFKASFRFPNGGTAEIEGSLRGKLSQLLEALPHLWVEHRPVVVPDANLPEGQEKVRTRRLHMANFTMSFVWHRIDIEDEFVVREKQTASAAKGSNGGGGGGGDAQKKVLKKWTEKESRAAYTWAEAGVQGRGGIPGWSTYRHQLEAFVDRVRGRGGSGMWVDLEDSLVQAQMLDMVYEKSGLGLRPTSDFKLRQ